MDRDNIYVLKLLKDSSLPFNGIFLDKKLFIKHGFNKNNLNAELVMGSLSLKVIISPCIIKENLLFVSTSIMKQLNLPDYIKLNVNITDNKIRIGPILGLFAKENTLEHLMHGHFVNRLSNYCGHEGILLFYFSYKEIDLQKLRINGFLYNFTRKLWEKRFLPLPDVIYNKGVKTFPTSQRARIERLLTIFEKLGIKKINSQHDFDKWETYCKLNKLEDMASFLPETVLYNSIKDLGLMTGKHNTVFAKGCRGNNGREVIKIVKENEDFLFSFVTFNKLISSKVSSLIELEKRLFNILGKNKFILQQGINVIKANGNAADVRALLQKDINNKWNITNIAIRIAAQHMPVTSTNTGSSVYRFEEGLQKCGLNEREIIRINDDCRHFLGLFLKALESEFGPFGEIGIDLAIDENDQLWFIECNANPAKTVAMLSGSDEEKQLTFLNPLLYAKYLTGF